MIEEAGEMEQLEPRRLAIAAYAIDFIDPAIQVGETIAAEISVVEHHPGIDGIRSVGVAAEWDAELLELVSIGFAASVSGFRSVEADAGFLELGAIAQLAQNDQPIGNQQFEAIATITFVALAPGNATLELAASDRSTATQPLMFLAESQIEYGTSEISVEPNVCYAW